MLIEAIIYTPFQQCPVRFLRETRRAIL